MKKIGVHMTGKQTKKRDIIIYISICLILVGVIYFVSATNFIQPTQKATVSAIETVTMQIKSPAWNITHTSYNTTNLTVAALLFECAEKYKFTIEKEYFSGYDSYIINAINGIQNGEDNSFWQFYINGEYATLGCSQTYVSENDNILWIFEPSPW